MFGCFMFLGRFWFNLDHFRVYMKANFGANPTEGAFRRPLRLDKLPICKKNFSPVDMCGKICFRPKR